MRVLLVSPNRLKPSAGVPWVPVEPLGMAYVAASLLRAGHDVTFLDLCFAEDPRGAVRASIAGSRPEAIGISIRNIDLMAYFNPVSFVGEIRETVDACRACSTAPVILGGSGFSVMPRELLRFAGADFGIAGEGEWSFPELLARIGRGETAEDLPGVLHGRAGSGIREAAVRIFPPLSDSVRPARHLIDSDRYREAGGTASVQTKRGCPFRCIYCTYPLVEGDVVRCRPANEVAEEFRELFAARGVREAYIVDSQFNYPTSHALEICEALAAQRDECRVKWSCMINPAHLSEELALLLRVARCSWIDLSIESASDRVLEALGKGYGAADAARAIEILKKCGLAFGTWVLCGGPRETEATLRETLEFLAAADVPDVLFSVGIRVCPGTEIERIAREEGAIAGRVDFLEPIYYLAMSPEDMAREIEPYLAGRPGWRIAALAPRF